MPRELNTQAEIRAYLEGVLLPARCGPQRRLEPEPEKQESSRRNLERTPAHAGERRRERRERGQVIRV
jgi:hypothetical protein